MDAFDDRLLSDFARSFYGYGDYEAPYWFVGMEEGGGSSYAEVERRLRAWQDRGRSELEDLPTYSEVVGAGRFFEEGAPLQPTWRGLIRILQAAEGAAPTPDSVREYQRDRLGRRGGQTALLELFPLPSPGTKPWLYARHSALPHLADRERYRDHFADERVARIRRRIDEHRPRGVVLYGTSYLPYWRRIAGGSLQHVDGLLVGTAGGTAFVLTQHPAARGVTNAYFDNAGRTLAAIMEGGA